MCALVQVGGFLRVIGSIFNKNCFSFLHHNHSGEPVGRQIIIQYQTPEQINLILILPWYPKQKLPSTPLPLVPLSASCLAGNFEVGRSKRSLVLAIRKLENEVLFQKKWHQQSTCIIISELHVQGNNAGRNSCWQGQVDMGRWLLLRG